MGGSLSDDEIKEKVIKHDYEFKALTKAMNDVVNEVHSLVSVLKEAINERMLSLEKNLDESFERVHKRNNDFEDELEKLKENRNTVGCPALKNKANEIDIINRAIFGKDGRGGILFDVEDMKKFMYKMAGAFTLLNVIITASIAYFLK